jgi:DNA-binding transcriptional LysR family regulator
VNGWLGVELRHLAALAAVAEEQSFRGAADRLGYVQSAVSQRIAQLEQAVGVRLVERSRGHKHVELTEAGQALLHHATQIDAHLNAARADLRELVDAVDSRSLRIGAFGSLAIKLFPPALAALASRSEGLRVETRESLSDRELFAEVESGKLDAAFAELPLEPGPFEWQELLVDPPVLIVPAESELVDEASPPSIAEIAKQPFVADTSWRMLRLIEDEFAAAGRPLDTHFSASSNAAVQALVGAGLGVAILPRLAVNPDDASVVAIDIEGLVPSRTLVCYWARHRRRGAALDAFLDVIGSVTAEISARAADPCVQLAA